MNTSIDVIARFEAKICIIPQDFTPDQVSLILGIDSSREWIKGDLNSGGRPFKTNRWELEFEKTNSENWLDLKTKIREFLSKYHIKLSGLALNRCSICLSIVMRKTDSHIGLDFSTEDLELFSELGVCLDINCYSV